MNYGKKEYSSTNFDSILHFDCVKITPKKIKGGDKMAESLEKKPIYQRWWFWVIVVIILIAIIGGSQGNNGIQTSIQPENIKNETVITTTETKDNKEKEETSIPKEYKNALEKAKSYSNMMYMSKQGIYDQLTSEYGEKFSADAAQYAIDNLNADYKKNALEKAKTYQNTMNMSKNAIYDQLISEYGEKFTVEEAQYAIDNLE